MNFTSAIEILRRTPIPIDTWKEAQVGDNNNGPYKQNYPNISVEENNSEPLIDVSIYGLASSDFYMDRLLEGDQSLKPAFDNGLFWSRALLRNSHARRLAQVDKYLRQNGLFLFIASGWRHPELQRIITTNFAKQYGEDEARRMFAPVRGDKAPPPHSTGAAADLEIWSLDMGCRLEMYYTDNDINIYNAYLMERMSASRSPITLTERFSTSLMNRRILFHVLCTQSVVFENEQDLFCNHPGEFWHFGDGDPLSAYLSQEPIAPYGAIYPKRHNISLRLALR